MVPRLLKLLKIIWSHPKARCYLLLGCTTAVAASTVQPLLAGTIYSGAEAIKLVKGLQDSSLYLGSAIAGVSATVLALMLTLLSMANKANIKFDKTIYRQIEAIGFISTIAFIGAIVLLLCLSLPVGEFENIPQHWLYRALLFTNNPKRLHL